MLPYNLPGIFIEAAHAPPKSPHETFLIYRIYLYLAQSTREIRPNASNLSLACNLPEKFMRK